MRLTISKTFPIAILFTGLLLLVLTNLFFAELADMNTDFMLWWWEKDIHFNNATGIDLYPLQWHIQYAALQIVSLGILISLVVRRSVALIVQKRFYVRNAVPMRVTYTNRARRSDLRWFFVGLCLWVYGALSPYHVLPSLDNWHYSFAIGVIVFLMVNAAIRFGVKEVLVIRTK